RKRSLEERVGRSSSGGSAHPGGGLPAPDLSPGALATREERAEALERGLAKIPPHLREGIRLVGVDHLSTADIGVRIGRKPEAVRKRIERALRACREALAREGMLGSGGSA